MTLATLRVQRRARGESASSVNASAYTSVGMWCLAGRYEPERISGNSPRAELAHVVQQRSGAATSTGETGPVLDSYEPEAQQASVAILNGSPVEIRGGTNQPALQLSPLSDEVNAVWPKGTAEVFRVLREHAPLKTPDPDLEQWMSIYLSEDDLWRAHKILAKGPESKWDSADKQEEADRAQRDEVAGITPAGGGEAKKAVAAPKNHAGDKLEPTEITAIAKMPGVGGAATSDVTGKLDSRRFVLHDTASGSLTEAQITEQDKTERKAKPAQKGPLGVGYSLVRRPGFIEMNRKSMFEQWRPTATEWEKGEKEMDIKKRVILMRQVSTALDPAQRTEAINFQMSKFGLSQAELKTDGQNPATELDPASKCVPAEKDPCIRTLGGWTIEYVCNTKAWNQPAKPAAEAAKGAAGAGAGAGSAKTSTAADDAKAKAAAEEKAKTAKAAEAACTELGPIFKLRAERVASTTNVEIRQVGDSAPLPKPPYTEGQYESVKNLYLKAALEAGAFPEITTHFWVDRALRGHNDPRCFDMHKLYKLISDAMGHNSGDRYGDEPKYGPKWVEHNVWWGKDCGDAPK